MPIDYLSLLASGPRGDYKSSLPWGQRDQMYLSVSHLQFAAVVVSSRSHTKSTQPHPHPTTTSTSFPLGRLHSYSTPSSLPPTPAPLLSHPPSAALTSIAHITVRPHPTMSPPPAVTLTTPPSPARARSVSQPVRDGVDFDPSSLLKPRTGFARSQSSSSILRAVAPSSSPDAPPVAAGKAVIKGRARSSSLVTVTEVGGDELETVVDRLGVGTNENADWVNAPGE